jgi:hypothetical protein
MREIICRNLFEVIKINHTMTLAQNTAQPLKTERLRATLSYFLPKLKVMDVRITQSRDWTDMAR